METKENTHLIEPVLQVVSKVNEKINVYKIHPKDGWSLCDLITANEDRLELYFPKTKAANLTPDLSKRFATLKTKEFDAKEEFLFTVKPDGARKIIGLVYIKELDWEKDQGEFAYCIDYNYEGKGITTKIVNGLSEYAFETLGLKTLQIIVHKTNVSSVNVAKRSSFTWIKTLPKEYTPTTGIPMDMELYERYA